MLYELRTIEEEFGLPKVPKDPDQIGIEFEIEFREPAYLSAYMDEAVPRYWTRDIDQSLRNGIELKSKTQYTYQQALDTVKENFDKWDKMIRISKRCSVHIHINMKNNNINDIVNFILLYTCLEESLDELSGHRRGNLYCLGIHDAYFDYKNLIKEIALNATIGRTVIPNDKNLKYSCVNLQRLFDLGTIEIRTMEGTIDTARVKFWIDILLQMKHHATGKTIEEYITYLDGNPEAIINEVFGLNAPHLKIRNFSEFFRKGYYRVVGLVNHRIEGDAYQVRLGRLMAKKSGKFRAQDEVFPRDALNDMPRELHAWNVDELPRPAYHYGQYDNDLDISILQEYDFDVIVPIYVRDRFSAIFREYLTRLEEEAGHRFNVEQAITVRIEQLEQLEEERRNDPRVALGRVEEELIRRGRIQGREWPRQDAQPEQVAMPAPVLRPWDLEEILPPNPNNLPPRRRN